MADGGEEADHEEPEPVPAHGPNRVKRGDAGTVGEEHHRQAEEEPGPGGVELHADGVHPRRNPARDQHVEREEDGGGERPECHEAEGVASEGWMTRSTPTKPTAQAAMRRGPTRVAEQEMAENQEDERLDEDDGQRIGERMTRMPETKAKVETMRRSARSAA